jgi:hypothetical protein
MAPDIPLDRQRPAEYVFARHVEKAMSEVKPEETGGRRLKRHG